MRKMLIAPSILSADFGKLGLEVKDVEKGKADLLHIDVMDGVFVPNITIGPVVIKGIKGKTRLPLDVHLMIEDPIRYIKDFRDAGADYLTVHYEACRNIVKVLRAIRLLGCRVGISLKPKTKLTPQIKRILRYVDLVLIMSVEPGFGGQTFMHSVVPKIRQLRSIYNGMISIDGGINKKTALIAREAGVDILVAGSSVFGQKNRKKAIAELR